MAIADELKEIIRLHNEGRLSDGEFEKAKARLLNQSSEFSFEPVYRFALAARIVKVVTFLVVISGIIWMYLRFSEDQAAANRAFSSISRMQVEMENELVTIPDTSYWVHPVETPRRGELDITVTVVRGNAMNVCLTDANGFEQFKASKGERFNQFPNFEAEDARSYHRSEAMQPGTYYLVLIGRTEENLTDSSSDVQVKISLK